MKRRELIALLGGAAAAWPLRTNAQSASSLPVLGVLWAGRPEIEVDFDAALRDGLRESGFVEGTNFAFAMRYANAEFERFPSLAAELAALNPRVIVTAPDPAVFAVHRAAPNVPLVMIMFGDPVALGLAQSYARPGGMVTGMTLNAGGGEEALIGKRIGLLKEVVSGLARIGVIVLAGTPQSVATQNGAADAASRLGLEVLLLPVRSLDDVEAAFVSGLRAGVGAFYIDGAPVMFTNRAKVAEFAARAGKPTVGQVPEQARAGLLMSYSADLADGERHSGLYAAKILAGAKPGDLPIEQASKFSFVINLRTAKSLGLTIPPTLLARADEVLE